MIANTSLFFPPWNAGITWDKFDVVKGVTATDQTYYFSTQPNNLANSPSGVFVYAVTQFSRSDDTTTLTYTWTGGPAFAPGSLIAVTNVVENTTVNYTGMALNGGSGNVSFINPGWSQTASTSVAVLTTVVNPAWTTGCFFIPAYSTTVETQQNVITAAFEPGYEQRQPASINPNIDQYSLVFSDRSNKEAKAIRAFVQINAGVNSFPIMIPIPELDNQPNQKFVSTAGARVVTKSWNLNDVSFPVKAVFEP